jgi:Flp pilus assembly protein TadG
MNHRKGVAAVEFAIVLPLFVIMFLGMVELGRGLMVQQVITNAAREGARFAASDSKVTSQQVTALVQAYLTNSHLPNAAVQ